MAKRKYKTRRKPKQFDLDIVIPVYGRADLLAKCLASIPAAVGNLTYQTIVIDDQGPDQDELNELYGSLNSNSRVIRHDTNVGFPKTVNDGIKVGISPLILILNTDIELQPDALALLVAEFDDPEVGVCAPKLLFPPDSIDPHRPANKVQHAGIGISFRGQISHLNIGWSADHPKVNERRELQAVTGACLMLRRDVIKGIMKLYKDGGDPTGGPFNEVYSPGTFEDIEFCLAVRSLGHKVIYTPEAVAYHHVGASVTKAGQGYPLKRNEMIFRARCGNMLTWDEWRYM